MKNLPRPFLAPTIVALLLGLACTSSNAARRVGLRRDLECGNLHPARELQFCSCSRKDRRWPRVFRGPKLPIKWRSGR